MAADIDLDFAKAEVVRSELLQSYELAMQAKSLAEASANNLEGVWSDRSTKDVLRYIRDCVTAYEGIARAIDQARQRLDQTVALFKAEKLAEEAARKAALGGVARSAEAGREAALEEQARAAEARRKAQEELASRKTMSQEEFEQRYPNWQTQPYIH